MIVLKEKECDETNKTKTLYLIDLEAKDTKIWKEALKKLKSLNKQSYLESVLRLTIWQNNAPEIPGTYGIEN